MIIYIVTQSTFGIGRKGLIFESNLHISEKFNWQYPVKSDP
jgi:hypothetical protein